jgi:Na+-driven multidrug efflux pump
VSSAIHTAIVVAVTSGLFVMIFGQFIAKPVLLRMGTMEDVIELAVLYLRIYLLGMSFIMLYDFGSSILRSIGDSEHPLYSLIAAVCKRVICALTASKSSFFRSQKLHSYPSTPLYERTDGKIS